MKTILIFLFTFIPFTFGTINNGDVSTQGLDDGWYEATVEYSNYSSGTYATYFLDVYIEYEDVTIIDFGDGGSVHSGINNSGYIYNSEYLVYNYDYDGNILSATSTVSIYYDNGNIVEFDILIE